MQKSFFPWLLVPDVSCANSFLSLPCGVIMGRFGDDLVEARRNDLKTKLWTKRTFISLPFVSHTKRWEYLICVVRYGRLFYFNVLLWLHDDIPQKKKRRKKGEEKEEKGRKKRKLSSQNILKKQITTMIMEQPRVPVEIYIVARSYETPYILSGLLAVFRITHFFDETW